MFCFSPSPSFSPSRSLFSSFSAYWFDSKPLYEDGKVRVDRLFQVLVSPKLQYYLHNAVAFSWPVFSYALDLGENYTAVGAFLSAMRFVVSIFVYYLIIRRMCAAVRNQLETDKDKGDRQKEIMFIEGVSMFAITCFLAFEMNGCTYNAYIDYPVRSAELSDLTEEDFLLQSCSIFMTANSCMGIEIVFLQIMSKLTFWQMSTIDLFTFSLKRFQLVAFFLALFPTFSATFLFARREQIDMLNVYEVGTFNFSDEPLMYVAVQISANYFSMIWLITLFILGSHAEPLTSFPFYQRINDAYAEKARASKAVRAAGGKSASLIEQFIIEDSAEDAAGDTKKEKVEEKKEQKAEKEIPGEEKEDREEEKEDREEEMEDQREKKEEPVRPMNARLNSSPQKASALKRWKKVKVVVKETGIANTWKRQGKYHAVMSTQHERLWIMTVGCFLVSLAFFALQVANVIENSEKSKGECRRRRRGGRRRKREQRLLWQGGNKPSRCFFF